MHRPRWSNRVALVLAAALIAGCVSASKPQVPVPQPQPPAPQAPPAAVSPADPAPPEAKDARLLVPDPTGHLLADVDRRLRIRDYAGQVVSAPEFPGDPVQWVGWAPRGDQLLVITGKPTPECCDLFQDARYWLVPVPEGSPQELTGLPQEVVPTWAQDEQSLYILDNWRRRTTVETAGERILRYDLATGSLTLLLDRTYRLFVVDELPGGDLFVGQYAGGGHAFYYRLPAGGAKLVPAAPFHSRLSPDGRWAVEGNLYNRAEMRIAQVATGEVTSYTPAPKWPVPSGDKPNLWLSDPAWAPDSRWLPGPGPQAVVIRLKENQAEPWRYDVATDQLTGPIGPQMAASGGKAGDCQPVTEIRTSASTAAYLTCDQTGHSLVYLDLTGHNPARVVSVGAYARLIGLSADGQTAAVGVQSEGGPLELRLVRQAAEAYKS